MIGWPKKITVDKRIVRILSVATYLNFPKSIKEIITNSYDADATKVNIDVVNDSILIEDNGLGMNEEDFDFYLRIAFKSRSKQEFTKFGRNIIGQFGIGFLSSFPFCLEYEIESKKRGSNEVVFAKIPTSKYFTHENKLIDVSDIIIPGGKRIDNSNINTQYTKVKLKGFSKITKQFFDIKNPDHKYSVYNYTGIEKLKWSLSEDLPLEFKKTSIEEIFGDKNLNFEVFINNEKLFRNLYGDTIILKNESKFEQIGGIKYKYFISTDFKPIQPPEARGLKIRNLNVGVGNRTSFGIGIEGRTYALQSNLTGEVQIISGMNDNISLSRDDFNFSDDYEKLKDILRLKITQSARLLEDIKEIEKFSNQSNESYRLNNLSFLESSKVKEKLELLKKKGFKIEEVEKSSKFKNLNINKEEKSILVVGDLDNSVLKRINLEDKNYDLIVEKWDTNTDFPACKIENQKIIINKNYPLFSTGKYLDIFFKMHVGLVLLYKNKKINILTLKDLIREYEQIFSNYL